MKQTYIIGLILSLIVFISACASSNSDNQVAVNSNVAAQQQANTQASTGIERGQLAPDFSVTTTDGKQISLSQFRNQQPVLVYFWATWCPFCRKDFSIVKDIYPKYSDKVRFLAIDLDTSETSDIIQQYKNEMRLDGIDFAPGNAQVLSDYQITHTTTKYAIGKNGVILYKGSGVFNEQQWETLFNGLINS